MQFVKNGPDLPERLLQTHEDGRVVFFCGAGISYPARLPGFKGLVKAIYDGLGRVPTTIEQSAIKAGQYDTVIGLLEADIVGNRQVVREQLSKILTPDLSARNATSTHEALLALAKNREGGYRLVTTNFDRIFEAVKTKNSLEIQTFQAPLLPIPKNRWAGLVYLHGLLTPRPTRNDLDRLVVSSGDFGLAYLTERWAARFVTELFRNYVVCFVGYSINDPVLRYMMDALAADRLLGESASEMFAFGSYSKGNKNEQENEWKSKSVTPILYQSHRAHAYLHRTLWAWGETYRDGLLGKERIVIQYARSRPIASTKDDDFLGRMLWALSDHRALPAKRFADFDPLPSLDWLEALSDDRFKHDDLIRFGVTPNSNADKKLAFSLVRRPAPYGRAPWMALMKENHSEGSEWDDVMVQIGRWLARHLDDPKLILWLAKRGGKPQFRFRRLITDALGEHPPRPAMKTLWGLVLSGRVRSYPSYSDLYDWRDRLRHDGLTPTLRLQLRDLLSPRVRLRETHRILDFHNRGASDAPDRVKDLVDWEIVLGTDHVHTALKDLANDPQWQNALPELLSDATALLHDALDLMRELGGVEGRHDLSYIHQPSISDHPQNRHYRDWTALIDLTRDAWLATAARVPERARLEIDRWLTISYPLFRRLVFFTAIATSLIPPREALDWLLIDDHWWLWSVETEREALRLLVTIAPKLDVQSSQILEQAILKGPSREMFRDDVEPEQLQHTMDREVWLLLAKYRGARGEIGADAAIRLNMLSQQYPAWQLADDQRDEFPLWMEDGEDLIKVRVTPKPRRELVQWLRENPKSRHWHDDEWGERCKRDFASTATALLTLAQSGEWFTDRWREALQAWADEKLAKRSWRHMGAVLATAPAEVVMELAHSLSWWLQTVAKFFNSNDGDFFALIRRMLDLYREESINADNDPVFRAIKHPVGQVTEASLRWWYRQSLEDNQGLPDVLKIIFTEICRIDVVSFRHGRLLLATHVITLFRVDREWTKRCLLPIFDWERSHEEARAAWSGFFWSPRLYRPLMETIKDHFLATAQHYADLGEFGEQYATFLTFAALEPGDTFSTSELTLATRSLPADGLQNAAEAVVRALDGTGDQRSEYWRNRVLPYLRFIWPKSRDIVTPTISETIARLCIMALDAFPEALHELKHWLQPLDHPDLVVNLLHEMKLCERFPEAALELLNAVIGDNTQWLPRKLKDCLDTIRTIQPNVEGDTRFQRLHEYLRRHGLY
jgi:hypothetical protein